MGKLKPENRIPILKLYENLIVVAQGALTDAMVNQLREDIPRALDRYEVTGIVVTVETIDVMDSYIARMIHDLAVTARLMGCETVICGVGSLVAATLVDMGMDLGGVPTERNLERALERLAKERRATQARLRADAAGGAETEPEAAERAGPRRRPARTGGPRRRRADAGADEGNDDDDDDGEIE